MKETKYLGMIMDEHLTLKSYGHCEAKTKQSKWIISQVTALCESGIT